MKSLLAVSIALSIVACGKPDPGPPPQTPESNASAESAPPGVADMASAAPVDSTPVATATVAAPPPSSAPTDATGQKGVASDKAVIVAFRTAEAKDKGICWAIVGTTDGLADFNKNRKKNTAILAKKYKMKAGTTYLDACPQDSIVGTCESAFKILVDYYSPTFTLDTAKRHCIDDQMGTWIQ